MTQINVIHFISPAWSPASEKVLEDEVTEAEPL